MSHPGGCEGLFRSVSDRHFLQTAKRSSEGEVDANKGCGACATRRATSFDGKERSSLVSY